MIIKIRSFRNFFLINIVLLLLSFSVNAQCAGGDNSITICDIADPSSQTVSLFSKLTGSPTAGGTWSDDKLAGGLNKTTGVLNVQTIKSSGVYTYTYTSNVGCTTNTAKITVTVGAYAGVSSPNISACDDDQNFNLFQGFNGSYLRPQSNGTWTDNDGTGAVYGNFLDASKTGLGTFSFTYTIPAIGTCAEKSSTVFVTVFRSPKPGAGTTLNFCSTDDLSLYTNYDLSEELTGEDSDGKWSEMLTSELSSSNDSFIDIQNIYNTKGAGVYNFTYTVQPTNPICIEKKSVITILIEEKHDFTGATLQINSDICEDMLATASYSALLKQGSKPIPNGNYIVKYSIKNATVFEDYTTSASFNNGTMLFNLDASSINKVGDYTITLTDIANVNSLSICPTTVSISDILHVYPLPQINTATLTIDPICKGTAAKVNFSGISNLDDGNYKITYNLTGSNSSTGNTTTLSILNKEGNFNISKNILANSGDVTIVITSITNLATGCYKSSALTGQIVVKPLTDLSSLIITASSVCKGQAVTIGISSLGTMTALKLYYSLFGANNSSVEILDLAVTAGSVSFTIPITKLTNTGLTTFVINDIIDNTKGCSSAITNNSKSFTINVVPTNPITADVRFCKNEKKTVASLIPSGTQYQWFDSLTSTTVLPTTALLRSGVYYVKEVNTTTGCESGRTAATIEINEVSTPVLLSNGDLFCGLDSPTLKDLSLKTTFTGVLTWYTASVNGTILPETTLLKNGETYYGFDSSTATNCTSDPLTVTVDLNKCDETPDFFIPDGFSPNGDGVNNTFRIPNIEYIYPNYTLEIYNRYGNLMFKGNIQKPEWDGKSTDASLAIGGYAPNGVYFYVVNFNKDNKRPKQGRLYLKR